MNFFKNFLGGPWCWYHGLIFLVIVNVLSLGWVFMDIDYFRSLNKPFFTPASWVFGPVWIFNNILVIYGNIFALNLWFWHSISRQPKFDLLNQTSINSGVEAKFLDTNLTNSQFKAQDSFNQNSKLAKNLQVYFRLQAFSWLNYILFTQLSFGTKIPAMFFWASASMLLLTIFSLYYAWQIDQRNQQFWPLVKQLKSITFSLVPLFLWLILATTLGWYIWQNN